MIYIKKNEYGGLDWHDTSSRWTHLKENGLYEIKNVNDVILKDILKTFPFLNKDEVLDAINNKTTFKFQIKTKKELPTGEVIYEDSETWVDKGVTYYENEGKFDGNKLCFDLDYCWGQFCYSISYHVMDIDAKDVCYLVENCFYAITKGCSLVERIYVEPFKDLNEAKEYLRELKKSSYSKFKRKWKNEKLILIADYNQITKTDWYKHNIEAIRLMKDKNQTILDASFSPFIENHIKNLEKL